MSLYRNINKRKKAGTSRSKKNSTITKKAYANIILEEQDETSKNIV